MTRLRFHRHGIIELVFKTDFLDLQVDFGHGHFIIDTGKIILAVINAVPEKIGQGNRHTPGFFAICNRKISNRIKCIVQKMRIHFGMQRIQFCLGLQRHQPGNFQFFFIQFPLTVQFHIAD